MWCDVVRCGVDVVSCGVVWCLSCGVEWSGVEWSGVEWSGVEWNGVEWSGVEWSGVEWSGVEDWFGLVWFGVGCVAGWFCPPLLFRWWCLPSLCLVWWRLLIIPFFCSSDVLVSFHSLLMLFSKKKFLWIDPCTLEVILCSAFSVFFVFLTLHRLYSGHDMRIDFDMLHITGCLKS